MSSSTLPTRPKEKDQKLKESDEESSEETPTWPSLSVSFPLPNTPQLRVHLKVTRQSHCQLIFLTSSTSEASSMGSFVYAIPNKTDSSAIPACTPLYSNIETLDFTTKIAIGVAKRSRVPTYVSCTFTLSSAGVGGEVKEQVDAFQKIINVTNTVVKACETQLE